MARTQRLIVLAGILISAVFLWFAFQGLNPAAVWEHIQNANLALLLLGAAWYFAAVSVIALRWQFLLRSVKFVPLRRLIPLVCIGYMGNNVYPLRSGEIVRVWVLQRNHGVPMTRALVVTAAERIFDGLVMLTFLLIGVLALNIDAPLLRDVATFAAPIFFGALLIFFALAARPNVLRRVVAWISRLLPGRLHGIALKLSEDVLAGLEGFRTPADLAGAIVCSYATWALEASVYWIVSFAFNLNIDYAAALLVVGAVNLAGLIPASPGQVGVFEFFAKSVLLLVGVAEAPATAYALVVHVVIWLPVTLLGFFFLARQGLGWSAIARARSIEQKVTA